MIKFLDTEVNTSKRSINHLGEKIKVTALNFDLLVYFLKNPNRTIDREELKQNVWRGRIVSDATVYKQIVRLKQDLLKQITQDEILQTVHGKGIIFLPEVKIIKSNSGIKPISNPSKGKKKNFSFINWIVVAIIVSVILRLFIQIDKVKQNNSHISKEVERLAILYHETDNSNKNINSQALAIALQSRLLMSDNLNVKLEKSKNQDTKFSKSSTNLIQKLGYNHVLNIQVLTHEHGVRAHVILRKENEIYPIQEFEARSNYLLLKDISGWVLEMLEKSQDKKTLISDMTTSESAFDNYIASMRANFENNLILSKKLLQRAIAKDPNFFIAFYALGGILLEQGETIEALAVLERIDLSKSSERFKFKVLNNIAGCYFRLGQNQKAFDELEKSMLIATKLGDRNNQVGLLMNQSLMLLNLNLPDMAREKLEKALLYVDESYQKTKLGIIYLNLSKVYILKFKLEKALYYLQQSFNAFELAGNKPYADIALSSWAIALLENSEYKKAYTMAQEAIKDSINVSGILNYLLALQTIIQVEMDASRFVVARVKLDDYKTKLDRIDNSEALTKYLELEYQYQILTDNFMEARALLQQLRYHADSIDNVTVKSVLTLLELDFQLKSDIQNKSEITMPDTNTAILNEADFLFVKARVAAHNKELDTAQLLFQKALEKFLVQEQKYRLTKAIEIFLLFEQKNMIKSENSEYWHRWLSTTPTLDFLQQ